MAVGGCRSAGLMVTPELLVAIEALDENEQRSLADALSKFGEWDDVEVDDAGQRLVRSRFDEMKANPSVGLSIDETQARIRAMRQR